VLGSLGLSPAEQQLYESLVPRLTVTVAELIAERGADARSIVDRLTEMGLLARLPGSPERVAVLPPETAFDLLVLSARRELAEERQRMVTLAAWFHDTAAGGDGAGLVETAHGTDAIVRVAGQLERGARHEVLACDAPPYLLDPSAPNVVEYDLLSKGVTYRVVYDHRAVGQPGRVGDIRGGVTNGEQARVGEVPIKMTIFDGTAFVPLVVDDGFDSALIIREPSLVAVLSALFEAYWERAVPLATYASEPGVPGPQAPTGAEQDLLALLVSGFTDREITTHLGWTERKVRQHIQRMKAQLGVETRFQAGYRTVLRGWLSLAEQSDESGDRGAASR
jgi:DNA-binding CsgD family transcriptional regulator